MTTAPNRRYVLAGVLIPPAGILALTVVLHFSVLGSLGPLDPVVQVGILALGFSVFRRGVRQRAFLVALIYFPLMLAVSWAIAFFVTGWLGWYEY